MLFCSERQVNTISPSLKEVLDFLTLLFDEGVQYSGLNTARSSLSTFIRTGGIPVGQHPLVCRFLRGVFQQRSAFPRYHSTWDVSLVLTYLQKLYPVEELSLKEHCQKLVMLIALLSGQRTQTLTLINIENICWTEFGCLIYIVSPLKHTRPGVHQEPIKLLPYPTDLRLCVINTLCTYLEKTKSRRGSESKLFISFQKPYKAVSGDTIRRWIKVVMEKAGIDTSVFKPHSTRAASTSAAKAAGVSMDEILSQAGWSNCATFKTFYNKPVVQEQRFAEAILKTLK